MFIHITQENNTIDVPFHGQSYGCRSDYRSLGQPNYVSCLWMLCIDKLILSNPFPDTCTKFWVLWKVCMIYKQKDMVLYQYIY